MRKIFVSIILTTFCSFGQKSNKAPSKLVKDFYHDLEVIDEYRNFENINDTIVLNWIKVQSEYTKSVFKNIKNKETYLKQVDKIVDSKYDENEKKPKKYPLDKQILFKIDDRDSVSKLYYRKNNKEDFKLFFSPKDYKPELKKEFYINYVKISPKKRFIAISITENGKEISDVVIYDLKNKKLLKDVIKNTWVSDIGGINWLENETGFIYTYLPETDKNSENFIKNSESVFHKLGAKEGEHKVLFSKKNNPEIKINPNDFTICNEGKLFFYARLTGAESYYDYYYAEKNKSLDLIWKPLFKKTDKISDFKIFGNQYVFTKEINGISCLLKTGVFEPNFEKGSPFIKFPKNEIVSDFKIIESNVFISTTINGIIAKLYVFKNKLREITLPTPSGSISLETQEYDKKCIWISSNCWNKTFIRYKYNIEKSVFKEDNVTEPLVIPEFNDIIYEELNIKTHDGLDLPLTIIYKKGLKKDGTNRVLMDGYGAYGASDSPYYNPYQLLWVQQGGVLVYTHVRGGGEKGEEWRLGGYKTTKPNTWKDFISSAEFLIANGYTKPEKLGIRGGSAGGILIGRAITERPDLFKAALIEVGILNVLRFELSPNGENNIKEFGSHKIKEDFESLFEMDAFHHIKKGVNYPTTLITSGMNDNRVIYWQPAKFAAKLMEFNSGKNPILYFNDYEDGHGYSSLKKQYEKLEQTNNFFNWQLGNPDYN